MSGIICAIRGGPHSRPTIDKAIDLAIDTGLNIYFLYVVNLDFLTHTASSRSHTIRDEMRQMGEFILLTVQSRASAKGVNAEGVIRQGQVIEEIIQFAKEQQANYIILGRPKREAEENVFVANEIQQMVHHIESESGAQVILTEENAS